jgi:hypothetical protein
LSRITKVPDMRTYQNEYNMLLNFPRCLTILLLETNKTDNNALDIDAIYNLKHFHGLPLSIACVHLS